MRHESSYIFPISQGKFALVDDDDFEMLAPFKWHICHGYVVSSYRNASGGTSLLVMARFIMLPDPDQEVDHISGNKLDNRRSNLRICTHQENCCNRNRYDPQ